MQLFLQENRYLMCKIDKNIPREPIGRITGRINKIFFGTLQKRLSNLEISRSFYPLLLIHFNDGELTQQNLADELQIDKVQVVHIIDYLSENGYVKRVQNPKDRREYKLFVTDKGRENIPMIEKTINELMEIAFKDIPSEKIEELYKTLYMVKRNLLCLKKEIE